MMRVNSLLLVDVIGAAAVAACGAVGIWCGLLNAGPASDQIHQLEAQVDRIEETLGRTKSAVQQHDDLYQQRMAAFGARDLLPESTSVEQELRSVSDLARRHRLELTGFTPLGTRHYPGVRELRYRMTADGRFADYVGFLGDFEAGASWADITFIKVTSANAQSPEDKSGELTISLYSATGEDTADAVTK